MSDCRKLEPLFTPYVDGELDQPGRTDVDAHLRECPPCRERVAAEGAIRDLLRDRRAALAQVCASAALRNRCASAWRDAGPAASWQPPRVPMRARIRSIALAASLVLVIGGFSLYEVTDRSERVMAAELVSDHVKCFGLFNRLLPTDDDPAAIEASLAGTDWHVRLPAQPERIGLALVGARLCLYGKGRVAHIMYTHNGHPVSVFMLPKCTRPEDTIGVLGHEAAIWSADDRTFVLIARESRADVQRMASFVQAALR